MRFFEKFVAPLANMALLYAALSAPAHAEQCLAHAPARCADIEQFLRFGGGKELRHFLGNAPGVTDRNSAADDLMRVLDGPPQSRLDLPSGRYLFSACQAHNCEDKGALILTGTGEIAAAAILHYPNYPTPVLTVFVREGGERAEIEGPIRNWAQTQLDDFHKLTGDPRVLIADVRFMAVGGPR